MFRKLPIIIAALILLMPAVSGHCCDGLPERQSVPMYVVADYAIEGGRGDEDGQNPYCIYYPKGPSFIIGG